MEALSNPREQNSEIESAVRNLLSCIRRHSSPQAHENPNSSPTVAPQPGTSASFGVGQTVSRPNTVQQEMQRAFPALYHGSRKRMKKMAPEPAKLTSVKFLEFQFCLLSKNSQKTPKDETVLLQAGLGRRTVNIPDNADHTEITKVLLQEYPKLQNLRGGWLPQKASGKFMIPNAFTYFLSFYQHCYCFSHVYLKGDSGQMKTTSLAQDSHGYTAKILKTSSNNGKNVIYIVPLQEEIDITPLPYNAPEFHNMPKNICMTCGISVPFQLLPCPLEDCQSNNVIESESDKEKENEEAHGLSHKSDVICLDACPICGEEFSAEVMPYHASTCAESFPEIFPSIMDGNSVDETASLPSQTSTRLQSTTFQLDPDHLTPGPSVSAESAPSMCDDWKRIELPERPAIQYRQCTLRQKEDEPPLKVRIDIREDMEDQEATMIHFYKVPKIDWTRPLQCRLEGDVATGDGVQRHFFSMVMHKLQNGFLFNVGNGNGTALFEGQADHLIPSTSLVLLQSDLFVMTGRIIGNSFLHGGPSLASVSPAIVHVLLGGSPQTATITIEDVADIDIRETIQMLAVGDSKNDFTEDQKAPINQLAMSWDLPVLTTTKRTWLLHNLLQHAVLTRTWRQVKQLRQGLKETMVWQLLEARPDVASVIFPRQSMADCSTQVLLNNIIWPMEDEEGDNEPPFTTQCRISGYLRKFVETADQCKLKQLVKFWVGWELPMKEMQVKVVQAESPTSSTCFCILRLPAHYTTYDHFKKHLESCIATSDVGFGLV
uniref:HECT-type E3 ubiquitin transferase n=1 Tax=Cyprinus carpio TaxID=7962 RepID=A0A8C2DYB6_CYPCA